ncbi:MAG: T9SS type A sorting domain-containing protein, partial [Bacteroidota bacterium]|nr:T9SS type A sorting domain-containing protein [Bacteroidota bacterium]
PGSGSVKLYLNDGLGTFLPGDTLSDAGSDSHNNIILIDQNFDGYPDIITDEHIWLNDANDPGNFILQDFTMAVSTHDFEVIDMNNDLLPDIYMGRFSSDNGDNIYLCDEPSYTDVDVTICFGDSLFVQNAWQTEEGIYLDNAGCETYTRTTLSFYDEIDTEVTEDEGTLTATATGAEYQWLDCDNDFAIINGEIAQSYTPTADGNYAVEITQNETCVDTSECYNVTVTDINQNIQENISIYPNPTTGIINLEAPSVAERSRSIRPSSVSVTNITGKTIKQFVISNSKFVIDLSNQPSGIYFIKIQTENIIMTEKIIKN